MRRLGAPEEHILAVQTNLAITYTSIGRLEESLRTERDVCSGHLKLKGEEHEKTLGAAFNYAASLIDLRRFEEAKALLRQKMPVARRILGEDDRLTLKIRSLYAEDLIMDDGATLEDLREAMTTLEDAGRIARRVLGGTHPDVEAIESVLQRVRATLRARETPSEEAV